MWSLGEHAAAAPARPPAAGRRDRVRGRPSRPLGEGEAAAAENSDNDDTQGQSDKEQRSGAQGTPPTPSQRAEWAAPAARVNTLIGLADQLPSHSSSLHKLVNMHAVFRRYFGLNL